MSYTHTTSRTMHGDLCRETVIPLGSDSRELVVTTRKGSSRRLTTRASVHTISECGRFRTMAFGFGVTGDFNKTIAASDARATSRAIAAQHDATDFDALKAEAIAYYQAKTETA